MTNREFLDAFYENFLHNFKTRQIGYTIYGIDMARCESESVEGIFKANKFGNLTLMTIRKKGQRKMDSKNNCKMMRDAKGDLVPVKYVSAFDKLRDRNVNKIVNNGRKLRTALEKFMIESIALMNEVAAQKESHGDKGNLSVSSFDGLLRVSIRQRYNIFFDARVREARDKMFAYVDSVLSRVKAEDAQALRVILQEAFRVGANNMLSTSKVMALIRMDIKNADWKAAQEVLKAALTPQKGKQYLMLETRPDSNHDFQSIRLDVADCWPVESAASVPEVV